MGSGGRCTRWTRHPCAPAPAPAQAFSLTPLAQNTELVAFRVCHDDPRLVTLTDVDTLGTMSSKASHLGGLVIGPEVEMQPTFDFLALCDPDEVQPWQAIRLRANLELLIGGVDHHPAKSLGPPLPQGHRIHRIHRVNDYLFPFQGHLTSPGTRDATPETDPSHMTKTPNQDRLGAFVLVGLTGFEPVASSLSGMRSNQLSYSPAALCGVCPAR